MIGHTIGGRYKVSHRVHAGGQGDVYLAYDSESHEPVAVKVLRPSYANELEFIERFGREVELLEELDNPQRAFRN